MMRYRATFMVLLVGCLLPITACAQQDAGGAEAALREGRYEDAIRIGSALVDSPDPAGRRTLARAFFEVGRYDEAIEAAADFHNLRGEALRERGRLAEAETAFRVAIDADAEDRLTAEFNLAELMYLRGERAEAMTRFDRFIDVYNTSDRLPAQDLIAVGNAVRYLGVQDPELFRDAVKAFDEATVEDPTDIEPHIRLGELLLEKNNGLEARQALSDALRMNPNHPRALLAMARATAFDGDRAAATELVQQALEINPNLVPARVFLARSLLGTEDHEAAEEELRRALEVNPNSLDALSTLAGLYYVRDDDRRFEEVRAQVRQLNPTYAGMLTRVAELAAEQRRYGDAATLAEEAIALDAQAWDAHGVLGLNQFRLGRIDDARESLEHSFAGDPYNVWIKNNLDLLDTFADYEMREVAGLEFMLHRDEADLLFPYLAIAAAQAHTALTERYGDRPRGPVRVEMYPRSADFSVRTVGLAGLGALGVSFGDVVALDSPAARDAGSYNWLTTLWHEMTHTITLGVSNNRVPRWLTEGMSVFEERQSEPGWGARVNPEFLLAYDEGELPPVSRLSEGFIRPKTPQHLGLAYEMASLVVEWIEETRGFDALIGMLQGYRDGQSTEVILRSVLRSDAEAIDRDFDAWLRGRANPENAKEFMRHFTEGQAQFQRGEMAEARRSMEAAAALFPVARSGSPYRLLAQIELRQGNEQGAIEALTKLTEADETAYAENLELAALLEAAGDTRAALAALDRAVWIYPYEMAPHQKLAELAATGADYELAVRERRAVVALRPTDRANAHYQLALALFQAGEAQEARVEVLSALEVAPGFEEAQQLLLRLHEGG